MTAGTRVHYSVKDFNFDFFLILIYIKNKYTEQSSLWKFLIALLKILVGGDDI